MPSRGRCPGCAECSVTVLPQGFPGRSTTAAPGYSFGHATLSDLEGCVHETPRSPCHRVAVRGPRWGGVPCPTTRSKQPPADPVRRLRHRNPARPSRHGPVPSREPGGLRGLRDRGELVGPGTLRNRRRPLGPGAVFRLRARARFRGRALPRVRARFRLRVRVRVDARRCWGTTTRPGPPVLPGRPVLTVLPLLTAVPPPTCRRLPPTVKLRRLRPFPGRAARNSHRPVSCLGCGPPDHRRSRPRRSARPSPQGCSAPCSSATAWG